MYISKTTGVSGIVSCLLGFVLEMLVLGDLPTWCDILIFKYIDSDSISVLCISLLEDTA